MQTTAFLKKRNPYLMKTLLTLIVSAGIATITSAQDITIARAGSQAPQQAPETNFTGVAHVQMLFSASEPARATGGLVTFQAGARTAWHTHPLGQTLIVTAGTGRVQQWGGPVQEIRQGDTVRIPPNVKHWHGASPDTSMTHLAIGESLNGRTVEWMEKVSDAQFSASPPPSVSPAAPAAAPGPTRAQQLVGDIAPKLAELTDEVLFGDIWARAQLSRRDRSLVTVSALVAMNRPDQLRSHLALARQNGVTEEELVEAITHLAFYAGWPSGMSAAQVAKEVFGKQ
jgi:4-carboxymuconolactone decarboxylase